MESNPPPDNHDLDLLQATTLRYYMHEANPANGLVRDKTSPDAPSSIAAVAELADALDSGSSVQKTWRFDSSRPHRN